MGAIDGHCSLIMAQEWLRFINYIFITTPDGDFFLNSSGHGLSDAGRLNGQEISMLGHFVFGLMHFS